MSLAVPKPLVEQAALELRDAGELAPEALEEIDNFIRTSYAFGFGHDEGLEEGRRMQLCRAVLDIASLRGIALSETQRETVEACDDLARLEQLYARLMSADAATIARAIVALGED